MPQQYLLPCSCGQKIRIESSQAGGQVACGCGRTLAVPTLRGIRRLEVAADAVRTKERPTWSRLHGAAFAGGMFAATLGVVLVALYVFRYAQIGGLTVDRSEEVIQNMTAQIDTITPVQALEIWSHDILEEGLGQPQAPFWVTAKEKVAEYSWWIKFGAGMILLGTAASAGAVLVGRR